MARVGVIGAGAFGTAMACVLKRSGHEVVIWAREPELAGAVAGVAFLLLARAIGTPRFHIYVSDDIIGVQLGGALKNVFGSACGISMAGASPWP